MSPTFDPTPITPTQVIYHGGCPDGFTAAWVFTQCHIPKDTLTFHKGRYGDAPPNMPPESDVFIVDFSYPRDVLMAMCDRYNSVTVLDHHESARNDLEDFDHPDAVIVFDMNRSGAGITWDYVMKSHRPTMVDYVEDRDLWKFELPHSEQMAAIFMAADQTFQEWDLLNEMFEYQFISLYDTTRYLASWRQKLIDEAVSNAGWATIDGHRVPIASCSYSIGSDVAGVLAKDHPFAAYYIERAGFRQFGLRSTDDGMDVSLIAKKFGGGGHKHAAGFNQPESAGIRVP